MLQGWVALTGTPGVGKSKLADWLRRRGVPNIDLARFSHDYGLVEGFDPKRMSAIVDPARLTPVLRGVSQAGDTILLDGHWAHEVPGISSAIVLRLRPRELQQRLEQRGWHTAKVRENVEAEAIDLILQEAVLRLGKDRVCEVDVTGLPLDDVGRRVQGIVKGPRGTQKPYRPGQVDWSKDLLDLF